ncbi:DUF87 domain-containing protein [Gordonia sp. PP30]|uniref:helicase HerA domain-containing protein n=1 Tax=Gordonia sp. PP30 TaxID=2935861 RepID=UPI001FFEAEAD|nr:DUF87 domain-containing protein [Gordonia sp. PP30]UQE74027.1 DUF87 domain-containing protein [Gordonia sp. PP30]
MPAPDTVDASEQDDAEIEAERERAAQKDAAEAQERALQVEAERYIDLLPEIQSARPLPAQTTQGPETPRLSGADWVADRLRRVIEPIAPAGTQLAVGVVGETVAATVQPPAGVKGRPIAHAMLAAIEQQGNLGGFSAVRAGGNVFTLRRDGVGATVDAWASHGRKAGTFHDDPESRAAVWDAAGLSVPGSVKGKKRRPKCTEFSEDPRGGNVVLELPGGLTIEHVKRARAALRQSLNAPDLEVTERGVRPVLHLNTKRVDADFPPVNPMSPTLFVRPRTTAERHVAAKDFVLPLGVRGDGSTILVPQAATPHMAIFGGTGSGKTTLVTALVDAACLQGASVLLADGRAGKDLRQIALSGRNGIIGYCAGSQASLHRAVQYAHDEYRVRQVLQEQLQREGIEYQPTPLVLVFDEWGSWLHTLNGGTKEQKAAAEVTRTRMEQLAAEARELKVFVVLVGQHAYISALPGELRGNLRTQVVVGRPDDKHLAALFADQRAAATQVRDGINPQIKGRSLVADVNEEGDMTISMFQAFFNPPGPAAEAMERAVAAAPRPRRISWRFPRGDELGGDGSWQDWTPATDPSSDTLPVQILDLPDGTPDPAAAIYDPTSRSYRPGRKPLSLVHATTN